VLVGIIPFVPFTGDAVKSKPLQVTLVISETSGVGCRVIITVNTEPEQLPEFGVTL
jgi:hypothetical protein